jgi:Predicted membrane protein
MIHVFKTRRFFKTRDKQKIIAAIGKAESLTSGEIRVHVEGKVGNGDSDAIGRAKAVFESLGMAKTELHNGVLIYLAVEDRKFAIIGDSGIDKAVPENFWDQTKQKMQALFKESKFADGVCLGIELTGEHLARYFPYQTGDVNELPDEISTGK